MYTCGLVSVSFRQNTVEEIVHAVKEAGLSCIEWGSDVHAPCQDTEKLYRIHDLCQRENIGICSYGTYFRLGQSPLSELSSYIDAAGILGTKILRLWCGVKGYGEYTESEWALLIRDCKAAAKMAEEKSVILCLECHHHTATDCVEGTLRLMKEVDSAHFKMYWQPNQYRTQDENVDYARQIAPYVTHIHVFNWDGDHRYPLGDGAEMWKEYLATWKDGHTLLLEFMPDDSINSLQEETKALLQIAGR